MKKLFSEPRLDFKTFDTDNLLLTSIVGNDDFSGAQGSYDPYAEWQE